MDSADRPDELDRMLGIDLNDPLQRHARELVANDTEYQRALVHIRRHRGLSREEVAERMGVGVGAVRAFERGDADLAMSTLRRYALAVGANVQTIVSWRADLDPLLRSGKGGSSMSDRHRKDEDTSDDEQQTADDDE